MKNNSEQLFKQIIKNIGENPDREGLLDTPKRHIKFLKDFLKPKKFNLTTFDAENYDEMIVQKGIPFYSLCEHHVLPFFGEGYIAYVPNKKIVGLSKLSRVLDMFAKKLQNQERITSQTANYLYDKLKPKGVAVVLKARHLCMEMRGIEKSSIYTTTSCLLGVFKTEQSCRSEFLSLIK